VPQQSFNKARENPMKKLLAALVAALFALGTTAPVFAADAKDEKKEVKKETKKKETKKKEAKKDTKKKEEKKDEKK
jgi:Ni/Co efflux regulator RcnB